MVGAPSCPPTGRERCWWKVFPAPAAQHCKETVLALLVYKLQFLFFLPVESRKILSTKLADPDAKEAGEQGCCGTAELPQSSACS